MDGITYKPHGIMLTQEYKTTVDAIVSRLESGAIDRVAIKLKGVDAKIEDPSTLDVMDGEQTVHAREHRHDPHSDLFDERRNVTIHRDWLDDPSGQI
jgi:hypothetical protein